MNQISRICPVTDAEAERIASRGALADLAGQITTVQATDETGVGAPPHTGERRAGGRRRRWLLAAPLVAGVAVAAVIVWIWLLPADWPM